MIWLHDIVKNNWVEIFQVRVMDHKIIRYNFDTFHSIACFSCLNQTNNESYAQQTTNAQVKLAIILVELWDLIKSWLNKTEFTAKVHWESLMLFVVWEKKSWSLFGEKTKIKIDL